MSQYNLWAGGQIENARVDAFIRDIKALYHKHGLALGHEDTHGNFIVEELDPIYIELLDQALSNLEVSK